MSTALSPIRSSARDEDHRGRPCARRLAAADLDRTGEAVRSVAALATERGAERFPLRCREAI
jgi:hypothetical protein